MTAEASALPWARRGEFRRLLSELRPQCKLEHFPSGLLLSAHTNDFEEFGEVAKGWKMDHQLIGGCRPSVRCFGLLSRSFQLALVEHLAGYCSQGETPKGSVTFAAPLDDGLPMVHRGRPIDALEMAVSRSGSGFELLNRSGTFHLVASVPEAVLDQYYADVWGEACTFGGSMDRVRFAEVATQSQ